jgi:hypothetical protein
MPMTILTFGPWAIEANVAATRERYQESKHGGAEACGCPNCINFALVREQAYPPALLALFDSLGIDFKKENEVHHYGRTATGLHIYRGFSIISSNRISHFECGQWRSRWSLVTANSSC